MFDDMNFNVNDRPAWEADGGGFEFDPMSADTLIFQPDVNFQGSAQFFGGSFSHSQEENHSSELSLDHSDDNLSLENSSANRSIHSHEEIDASSSSSVVSDSKKLKRERNKVSASKYRAKKKEYVTGLEAEVEQLHQELSMKNSRMSALESENRLLKEQLSFMQKLFAIASNNPAAVSGIAMAFAILFAFVIPFNVPFSNSSLVSSPAALGHSPVTFSGEGYVPTHMNRKILQVHCNMDDEAAIPEGMVQLVMIGPSDKSVISSNITWFAELPKSNDVINFDDQVCKVVNLQSTSHAHR
eukprot:TRINITY_DN3698_c0_g1_i1.p1 TRINITY_DN3698_c0_g1~~TRINITY_DN3698_c0_g1_i1.p1  ORF type:complete len:299 (+),score=70.08 TRINITY_DN3698_c0_g1_i1:298-1194(+)